MKKPFINRERALAARPEQAPALKLENLPDGGIGITVRLEARGLLGWMSSKPVDRTFKLDLLGKEVYEACSGAATVKKIAAQLYDLQTEDEEESVPDTTLTVGTGTILFLIFVKHVFLQ